MKKIDGVQAVNVSLNKGVVTIDLAAGNHLTMPELRKVIASNGFSPKEATVVVDGVLDNRSGSLVLRVDGTNEAFTIVPLANASSVFDEVKRASAQGAHVELGGRIEPPRGSEALAVATVKSLP